MTSAIIVLVYSILFMIAAVEILTARRDVTYKLVWLLVVLLLPVLGLLLYYLVGRADRLSTRL
jgi:hypothetical protein